MPNGHILRVAIKRKLWCRRGQFSFFLKTWSYNNDSESLHSLLYVQVKMSDNIEQIEHFSQNYFGKITFGYFLFLTHQDYVCCIISKLTPCMLLPFHIFLLAYDVEALGSKRFTKRVRTHRLTDESIFQISRVKAASREATVRLTVGYGILFIILRQMSAVLHFCCSSSVERQTDVQLNGLRFNTVQCRP